MPTENEETTAGTVQADPSPRCGATIEFGDDYGDNSATFHCQRVPHDENTDHTEWGNMGDEENPQPYILTWKGDCRHIEKTDDLARWRERAYRTDPCGCEWYIGDPENPTEREQNRLELNTINHPCDDPEHFALWKRQRAEWWLHHLREDIAKGANLAESYAFESVADRPLPANLLGNKYLCIACGHREPIPTTSVEAVKARTTPCSKCGAPIVADSTPCGHKFAQPMEVANQEERHQKHLRRCADTYKFEGHYCAVDVKYHDEALHRCYCGYEWMGRVHPVRRR